jgi:hypothetical protein
MAAGSEIELYEPVKQYFEGLGYEVKGEVRGCDLVAFRKDNEQPVIVELKKSFNLTLVFQGMDRLKASSQVYLAVEYVKKKKGRSVHKWSDKTALCRRLGMGLLTVQFFKTIKPRVEVLCHPPLPAADGIEAVPLSVRPVQPLKSKEILREAATSYKQDDQVLQPLSHDSYNEGLQPCITVNKQKVLKARTRRISEEFAERSGDYNIGGSTRQKLVTAYREKTLRCAFVISRHGSLKASKVGELTGTKKAAAILQRNYYGWFQRVGYGIYRLTPEGEAALHQYANVVQHFEQDLAGGLRDMAED